MTVEMESPLGQAHTHTNTHSKREREKHMQHWLYPCTEPKANTDDANEPTHQVHWHLWESPEEDNKCLDPWQLLGRCWFHFIDMKKITVGIILMFQCLKVIVFYNMTSKSAQVRQRRLNWYQKNSSLWQEQSCSKHWKCRHTEEETISCRAAEIHWAPERTTGSRSYSCHTALSSTTHSSHINHAVGMDKKPAPGFRLFMFGPDKTDRSRRGCLTGAAAALEVFCLFVWLMLLPVILLLKFSPLTLQSFSCPSTNIDWQFTRLLEWLWSLKCSLIDDGK